MLDCTDAECRDWREHAKQNLKFAALDPMMRDFRSRPMDGMRDMVEKYKADIKACDIILVNFVKLSLGTSNDNRKHSSEMLWFNFPLPVRKTLCLKLSL